MIILLILDGKVDQIWSSPKIYDIWFEEAAALGAKFDKIRTCNTHTIFAAQAIRQSSPDQDSEGVMMVSNCSVSEGITPMAVLAGRC